MFTSQAVGKDGGILLEIFMERDKVKANENAKIRKRQISSYLAEKAWSIKDLL